MSNENDSRVLALKEKINEKKANIKKLVFTPVTNCSLEFEGTRHNLHVLKDDSLTYLLIKLNSMVMSMANLGIKDFKISGYDIKEWINDIKQKLLVLTIKEEEASLKQLESKLDTLLSTDKKTQIELDNISKLLE